MNQSHINIDEEIRILEYQPVVFWRDTELGDLYAAIAEKWNLKETGRTAFMASFFYSAGRIHGIREERARRKAKNILKQDKIMISPSSEVGYKGKIKQVMEKMNEKDLRNLWTIAEAMAGCEK